MLTLKTGTAWSMFSPWSSLSRTGRSGLTWPVRRARTGLRETTLMTEETGEAEMMILMLVGQTLETGEVVHLHPAETMTDIMAEIVMIEIDTMVEAVMAEMIEEEAEVSLIMNLPETEMVADMEASLEEVIEMEVITETGGMTEKEKLLKRGQD